MPEIPIREAAFSAILAVLEAAGLTADGTAVTVERNRMDDVAEEERPLLVLLDGDQDPDGGDSLEARHNCRAILAGYIAAGTPQLVTTLANQLHAEVVRALVRPGGAQAAAPIALGDGIHDIQITEGPFRIETASVVDTEAPFASFTLGLSFETHSPWGSPFITLP